MHSRTSWAAPAAVTLGVLVGGASGGRDAVADDDHLFVAQVTLGAGPVAIARDAGDGEDGYGGLVHLGGRGAVGKVPAPALGFDLELGYAGGTVQARGNIGAGVAATVGKTALAAMLGVGLGAAPYATADVSLELSAGYYPRPTFMLWGGVAHAEGLDDVDRDQLDVRVVLPREMVTDLGLTLGVRGARIDDAGTPAYLLLATVGIGMSGGF